MITFSDKQLKIPEMQRPVYLVTGGMSKFDRAIPEKRTEELCVDAFTEAADFIDMTPTKMNRKLGDGTRDVNMERSESKRESTG